jgi:flagellar motor switch/type III secretory pathway protein FliN
VSEQVKRVGRPRQWASEAERKRAYRSRKAAEIADPLRQRQAAQDARTEAAIERSTATAANLQAERWRRKAKAAEKRADTAEQRAVREAAAAQRFLAERDESRRLLRRKLQWAKHAGAAHLDSQELLAMVAELYAELARLRKEIATLRRTVSSGR